MPAKISKFNTIGLNFEKYILHIPVYNSTPYAWKSGLGKKHCMVVTCLKRFLK